MTIISQQKKDSNKLIISVWILVCFLAVTAMFALLLYNQLVNLRHEISKEGALVRKAEVQNAELKNNLYKIIDIKNLEAFSSGQSLVLDKNPKYFENNPLAAKSY